MLSEVIKYLKDNPEGYWFKPKLYGWGWVPVKWQGLAVILGYLTLFIIGEIKFINLVESGYDNVVYTLVFTFFVISLTIILIWICYKKGEKPRWQWGPPKQN